MGFARPAKKMTEQRGPSYRCTRPGVERDKHTQGIRGETGEKRGQAEGQLMDSLWQGEETGVWQLRDPAGHHYTVCQ